MKKSEKEQLYKEKHGETVVKDGMVNVTFKMVSSIPVDQRVKELEGIIADKTKKIEEDTAIKEEAEKELARYK